MYIMHKVHIIMHRMQVYLCNVMTVESKQYLVAFSSKPPPPDHLPQLVPAALVYSLTAQSLLCDAIPIPSPDWPRLK